MVRFSCFNGHIHPHKSKKSVHLSAEAMQKALEDRSKNQAPKDFTNLTGTSSLHMRVQFDTNVAENVTSPSSDERDCKSEEIKSKFNTESDIQVGNIKKSRSLGSGLDVEGRFSSDNISEEKTDQGFFSDGSRDQTEPRPVSGKDVTNNDSLHLSSDMVNNDSIFSIGGAQQSEKGGHENFDTQISNECCIPRPIVKSSSFPNISSYEHSTAAYVMDRSRSFKEPNASGSKREERIHEIQEEERDVNILNNETNDGETENYDNYNYVGSSKDWIIPVMDEVKENNEDNSTVSSMDFKKKRIEEWVMDLQHCDPLEEETELLTSNDHVEGSGEAVLDHITGAKLDAKVTPGMEAAKKYLSSLSPSATTAQLANHGLAVIPFLSAFVSLRALNLSGNAIVRITAGALPRGLHILNLSKNNISTIEGLRDLTRLRILDLSYNRIFRIGHGLASCSSLKELYLAGNKISEVEGLHRLLKLNVLDLRFNKLSTTKCLGQLAANYSSLQAISLEGNPAQKNVGDEPLKKYLQGLLPHLAYFNRQSIKAGTTLKDTADRSARLGISAHQKNVVKTMRKGTHGSSSILGRRNQGVAASPKPSRGSRHGIPPPPSGTKVVRPQLYDFGSKLLNFRPDLSMRRSHSEGTLGV